MEKNLNISKPNLDEWGQLYQASIEFKKIKPWEWMYDDDIFGVKDAESGEIAYCCIMGNEDEYFGIAAYLGSEGLNGILSILSGEIEPDDPDFIFSQKCLLVSFEDREALTSEDRKIIKELGIKFRGRNEWPIFRNYTPGYFPWFITAAECRFLTDILKQATYVALKCKEEGKDFLETESKCKYIDSEYGHEYEHKNGNRKDDKYDECDTCDECDECDACGDELIFYTRTPRKKDRHIEWNSDYIAPEVHSMEYASFYLTDELKIRKLQNLGRRRGPAWEVDTFYSPGPVQETKGERPYYPKVCLVYDQGRGMILGFDVVKNIREEGSKFLELVSRLIEECKQPPSRILVQREETYYLLFDFCKQVGINLENVYVLENLDEARYEMRNFFDSINETGDEWDD